MPKSVPILTLKSEVADITEKTTFIKNITAPVKQGDKVGTVEIFIGNTPAATMDIVAKESVDKKTYFFDFFELIKSLFIL